MSRGPPTKNLNGLDIIVPSDNMTFLQAGNSCGTVILSSTYVPKRPCKFTIQAGNGGIYVLNNSNVLYDGNIFIHPNKTCDFNLYYDRTLSVWKLACNEGSLENNSIVIDWTKFFNKKVAGAPPLAARKYAIFINGIYNALLQFDSLFDQAVVNTAANVLFGLINSGIDTSSIYDKYPKLEGTDLTNVTNFVTTFRTNNPIPTSATNPSYILPSPAQSKWSGTNPVLPNWNSTTINYISNSYTTATPEPFSDMDSDAKELTGIVRTPETNEIAYHFANTPPPAHMIKIACSMIAQRELTALSCAKLLSLLAIAISDAGLYAWTSKYTYWGARPFQYIPGFSPLITTPNFPGYISGHSTFSGAWDQILGMMVPSHKEMAKYIADLSGMSRLYGGIHFMKDNVIGLNSGREIAKNVYSNLLNKIKNNLAFM
jgi:hypothetical protein